MLKSLGVIILLASSLAFSTAVAAAAAAARAEFVIGNVVATDSVGRQRALAKSSEVHTGDTVDTREGRVQLRFTDGAYVSLQPQTQFHIDQYHFNGQADGTERGFFTLLKGGLRTITGLVGRAHRSNYEISTRAAIIGIRGTEYTLAYDGAARGQVGEGEIAVCNAAGCLNVASGQAYYVAAADTKPMLSTVRSFLAPPPFPLATAQFVAGDLVSSTGVPIALSAGITSLSTRINAAAPSGNAPAGTSATPSVPAHNVATPR